MHKCIDFRDDGQTKTLKICVAPLRMLIDAIFIPFNRRSQSQGGTPYIRMIGMLVVFLGVLIGDLVFLGVVQVKSIKKLKPVFVRV